MKLLLDTHVWLWTRSQPKRLGRRVSSAVGKSTNELWLSPASMWEVLNLCRKGRLKLDPDPVKWIQEALIEVPLFQAPITQEVALATRGVWLPHHDPIDFILAATAKVHGLTLVTADEQLLAGTGFSTLSARQPSANRAARPRS